MSSPASRRRQRHRRRAQEKLWAVQRQLADRHADLAAYERVLADLDKRLPFPGSHAVLLVTAYRDMVQQECADLAGLVTAATEVCKSLAPIAPSQTSDSAETISW